MRTQTTLSHVLNCLIVIALGSLIIYWGATRSQAQGGTTPNFDFGEDARSIVIQTGFTSENVVNFEDAAVIRGYAPSYAGQPPMLLLRLLDYSGTVLDEFYDAYPYVQTVLDPSGPTGRTLPTTKGMFVLPLYPFLKQVEIVDVPTQKTLSSIDVEPTIREFCTENPSDPICVIDLGLRLGQYQYDQQEGAEFTIPLEVVNPVSDPANPGASRPGYDAQITTALPRGVTFVRSDVPCEQRTLDEEQDTRVVVCTIGTVLPGQTRTVQITVRLGYNTVDDDASGPQSVGFESVLTNAAGDDPKPVNNRVTFGIGVIPVHVAQPSLTFQKASKSRSGGQIEWSIEVANVGDSSASNVVITDDVLPSLRIISALGTTGTVTINGQRIEWVLSALDPGAQATLTVISIPSDSTVAFSNKASLNADGLSTKLETEAWYDRMSNLPGTGIGPSQSADGLRSFNSTVALFALLLIAAAIRYIMYYRRNSW